jgi:hypothetical protein
MACPVCFGGEDAAARESLNAGIGVLMGVTTIVLACFARLFFTLARRSREAAHLVGVGAGLQDRLDDVAAGLQTRRSDEVMQ